MQKGMEQAKVIRQKRLQDGIYSLWLSCATAKTARPGQFVNLYPDNPTRLLPRPISICDTDGDALRLVYRMAGEGTKEFSALSDGDEVRLLGPLGNGFLPEEKKGSALLFGGGIGVPPMLFLAKELKKIDSSVTAILGYLDEPFLLEEFRATGAKVLVATESGREGVRGNVMDALRAWKGFGDMDDDISIFSCGPKPMLSAIKEFAKKRGIERCYLSMEERMACGIGACLGCVTSTVEEDCHSKVKNQRVCKDGPVFLAKEVTL